MPNVSKSFKSAALTALLIVIGAAVGWTGMRVLRHGDDAPKILAGDFSRFTESAHRPAVLFATSTCPFCRRARALLDATHVDYQVYEIDTSEEAHRIYQTLGVTQVPVLITRDWRIVGFSEPLYRLRTAGLTSGVSTAAK
ncbi:MAG TPA: glutaredoxin family protein [Rudaea sp.]